VRRITIELTLKELSKFEGNTTIQKIKSLEILQFLREDPQEFAVICRIEFTDPNLTMEEFVDDEIIELQMLEHDKDGAYTYFLKSRPTTQPEPHFDPFSPGGYLSVPFEIRDGMARITYLGNTGQIRLFLEQVEKAGVRYKVSSLSDAKFSHSSPLNRLTEKQRRVLVTAYRLGYYDLPRRISSQQLASKLNVGSSTLINHRRRAERRLLAEMIGQLDPRA
jgi:HTH DNA binding domain